MNSGNTSDFETEWGFYGRMKHAMTPCKPLVNYLSSHLVLEETAHMVECGAIRLRGSPVILGMVTMIASLSCGVDFSCHEQAAATAVEANVAALAPFKNNIALLLISQGREYPGAGELSGRSKKGKSYHVSMAFRLFDRFRWKEEKNFLLLVSVRAEMIAWNSAGAQHLSVCEKSNKGPRSFEVPYCRLFCPVLHCVEKGGWHSYSWNYSASLPVIQPVLQARYPANSSAPVLIHDHLLQ